MLPPISFPKERKLPRLAYYTTQTIFEATVKTKNYARRGFIRHKRMVRLRVLGLVLGQSFGLVKSTLCQSFKNKYRKNLLRTLLISLPFLRIFIISFKTKEKIVARKYQYLVIIVARATAQYCGSSLS